MPVRSSSITVEKLPLVALTLTAVIGSVMGIFARQLALDLNVAEQVALRSFTGVLILYALFFRHIRLAHIAHAPASDIRLTLLRAVSMFAIAISLGTIAFTHGNYAAVAVVMALPAPAFLGIVLFREKASRHEALLVMLAFAGATTVILGRTGIHIRPDWSLVCAMAATLFMGFGILARKRQTNFLNGYETTLLMLATATVVMGIIATGWMIWTWHVPRISLGTLGIAVVAGGANVAFLTFSHFAIPRLRSVVINNLLALQPFFGAMIGLGVFGETLSIVEWLGCGFILLAVILIANPNNLRYTSRHE